MIDYMFYIKTKLNFQFSNWWVLSSKPALASKNLLYIRISSSSSSVISTNLKGRGLGSILRFPLKFNIILIHFSFLQEHSSKIIKCFLYHLIPLSLSLECMARVSGIRVIKSKSRTRKHQITKELKSINYKWRQHFLNA